MDNIFSPNRLRECRNRIPNVSFIYDNIYTHHFGGEFLTKQYIHNRQKDG